MRTSSGLCRDGVVIKPCRQVDRAAQPRTNAGLTRSQLGRKITPQRKSQRSPDAFIVKFDVMKPRAEANCPSPLSTIQLAVPAITPGSRSEFMWPCPAVENLKTCSASSPNVISPLSWNSSQPVRRNSDSKNARSPSDGARSVRMPDCEITVLMMQLTALPVVLSGCELPQTSEVRPLTCIV